MAGLDYIEALNKVISACYLLLKKIKMRKFILLFSLICTIGACKEGDTKQPQDTTSEGTIHISIEESYKPFMQEQLKVFAASFPKANIIAHYKSEIDCFKDLAEDSTRMIIVTRGLDKREQESYYKQLRFNPTFGILAYNAIAILVNKNAKDSLFSLKDLKNRLLGIDNQQVVMDGSNLTGIVRFLKDSLAKNEPFGKNVKAANGSAEVINYIKGHPNAIGFVGMNWIGDTYDKQQVDARNYVKTALLECTLCNEKGLFAHPSQSTIGKGQYSLSLPVYYILKENAPGLGSGLLNFMSLERGQLIFRRSFLVPAKMSFTKRNGMLN